MTQRIPADLFFPEPYQPDQMSGFFEDLKKNISKSDIGKLGRGVNNFFNNAVEGLGDSISGFTNANFENIKDIAETMVLVVRAAVNDVEWKEVEKKIGEISKNVGDIIYYSNPYRTTYDILSKSSLTSHAFGELDKFSGNLLTRVRNVSILPARVLRGEKVTRQELLVDLFTIIQVAALVFGGPAAVGAFVGSSVGSEVCKHQVQSSQKACMAAFTIVGAAAGQAYQSGALVALKTGTVSAFSQIAIQQCQDNKLIGRNECQVLGTIASRYGTQVAEGKEVDWLTFLGEQARDLGKQEILKSLFPPGTPEYRAITEVKVVEVRERQGFDPKLALAVGGAALFLALGVS